ncbi:MAG: hypothetical protein AAB259_04290, partial [Pseudomonadota bacterium]
MPWYIDTADSQVHEKMLRQVLQEAGEIFVTILRRSSVLDRITLIKRLVSQFPQHHLENLLTKITPTHADLILDFLVVYPDAMIEPRIIPGTQMELMDSVWVQIFEILLEDAQFADNQAMLPGRLIKKIAWMNAQDPVLLAKRMSQAAERYMKEKRIGRALSATLQALIPHVSNLNKTSGKVLTQAAHRTVAENGIGNEAGAREEKVAEVTGLAGTGAAESTDTQRPAGPAASTARRPQTEHEAIYLRILAALRKAKLIATDNPATDLPEGMQIAELKHHLHRILRSKEMRIRLTGKLAQRILLDITFLLAPQAAALTEQLLSQAEKLYRRQPDTLRRGTRAHWEQRLWEASLIHLLAQADRTLDPAAYIRALAQGVSAEADLPKTLQAWYEALDQSATYGTIHTLLHTLIASAPEVPAEANTIYQKLHRRLTANQPAPEQQDLPVLLEELATRHPAQLQRIVQDLRKERYDLRAAQLNTAELRALVEMLLKTASSITDANRPTFLQAIETQAGRVSDPQTYYRRLLEDLLQDREIDLEAIAAQAAHRTVAENGIGNEAGAREERVAEVTGLAGAAESTDTQRPAGPAAST